MGSSTHVIRSQILEIEVNRANKDAVEQRFKAAFLEKVRPRIEAICDQLVGEDRRVIIDSIDLDLGTIKAKNIQDDLEERFAGAFETQLRKAIRKSQRSANSSEMEKANDPVQLLAWFLDHGRLPWWSAQSNSEAWKELLTELESKPVESLKTVVASRIMDAKVRWRIVRQLPIALQDRVLKNVLPNGVQALEKEQKALSEGLRKFSSLPQRSLDEIIRYALLSSAASPSGPSRQVWWKMVMGVLIEELTSRRDNQSMIALRDHWQSREGSSQGELRYIKVAMEAAISESARATRFDLQKPTTGKPTEQNLRRERIEGPVSSQKSEPEFIPSEGSSIDQQDETEPTQAKETNHGEETPLKVERYSFNANTQKLSHETSAGKAQPDQGQKEDFSKNRSEQSSQEDRAQAGRREESDLVPVATTSSATDAPFQGSELGHSERDEQAETESSQRVAKTVKRQHFPAEPQVTKQVLAPTKNPSSEPSTHADTASAMPDDGRVEEQHNQAGPKQKEEKGNPLYSETESDPALDTSGFPVDKQPEGPNSKRSEASKLSKPEGDAISPEVDPANDPAAAPSLGENQVSSQPDDDPELNILRDHLLARQQRAQFSSHRSEVEGSTSASPTEIPPGLEKATAEVNPSQSFGQRRAINDQQENRWEPRNILPDRPGFASLSAPLASGTEVFIDNAGLVLLWPFVKEYFSRMKLLEGNVFISEEALFKGIHALQFLVTGKEHPEEFLLPLNKIMCGQDIELPVPKEVMLSEEDKAIGERLLGVVPQHWSVLKNTSIDGLRQAFLMREGKLIREDRNWKLIVSPKTFDMIMDKLPWSISVIKTGFMPEPLLVEW